MRSARKFFEPKAIGAPTPPREIPFRPARMIHFFDPGNPKMAAKLPELAKRCDVLLGNLEDAIERANKVAAREGLIEIARKVFSPPPDEVKWAKRVIEQMGDGSGTVMIEGKMQDDATYKQCKVMVGLAEKLAERDPELKRLYGF